jgi:hypothetical protein
MKQPNNDIGFRMNINKKYNSVSEFENSSSILSEPNTKAL